MSNPIDMQFQEVGNDIRSLSDGLAALGEELCDFRETFKIFRSQSVKELERRICDLEREVEKQHAGKPVGGRSDRKAGAARLRGDVAGN